MPDKIFKMIVLAILVSPLCSTASDQYESPPTLSASKHIPVELLESDHYILHEEVDNDGFLNTYTISSDFGEFRVYSRNMLKVRLDEIDAIVQLQNLSKTEVFAAAAINAGLSPLKVVADFSKRPIQTVLGLPGGIGRKLQRYIRKTKNDLQKVGQLFKPRRKEDGEQKANTVRTDKIQSRLISYTEDYFKVGSSMRRWHRKLGTNPYTSNTALHESIRSVSWADSLGRFGLKQVSLPDVAEIDILDEMNDLVWSLDAFELRDHNRKLLLNEGVDATLVELFFDTPSLRPKHQTALIDIFLRLDGVNNREELLAFSLSVEDEIQAMMLLQSANFLANQHKRSPLSHFVPLAPFLTAETRRRVCLSVPGFDHVVWTEQAAEVFSYLDSTMPASCRKKRLLTGSASPLTLSTLSDWGWQVKGSTDTFQQSGRGI